MCMANITLAVPDELHVRMKEFSEIRWSEVVRKSIEQKVKDLEMLEKITAKSRLTEKDAKNLSKKINRTATKKILNDC